MNPTLDSSVTNTVDIIGKEAIDAIAGDVCLTYGWLKTNEITKVISLDPFYVSVHDAGKLIAFTPFFISTNGDTFWFGPYYHRHMKRFLKMGKRLRLWKNDFLLCWAPNCCRTKISMEKNVAKDRVFNEVIKKIDNFCKERGILFSFFPFVSEFDKSFLLNLEKLGYRKLFCKDTFYLDVCWSTFDDYIESLKRRSRKTVRQDVRFFEKSGITIELVKDFKDLSATLSDLYANLFSKYNPDCKSRITPFFYETLNNYTKDETQVFIAKKKGTIVGFSFVLPHGEILDGFQCGFNYDLIDKKDRLYFQLLFYETIKWAIKNGIRKIDYRTASAKTKRKRGCKTAKAYTFVKCHNRLVDSQIGTYLKMCRIQS